MLVEKGDCLGRVHEDGSCTPYEVIMADDEFFLTGEIAYKQKENIALTNIEDVKLYSNVEGEDTLAMLGFAKLEGDTDE